jgi:hypothetical protein
MNRRFLLSSLLALSCLTVAPTASAGWGIGGSIGTGFIRMNGSTERFPTNLEILPFYKLSIISIDLGLKFNFEEPRDFVFRPGARINIPVLPIYGRIAIPIEATNGGSYGLLAGIGFNFGLGPVGVFAEALASLRSNPGFAEAFPMEFRVGAQFAF